MPDLLPLGRFWLNVRKVGRRGKSKIQISKSKEIPKIKLQARGRTWLAKPLKRLWCPRGSLPPG